MTDGPPRAEIVSVGNELLNGEIVDSNKAFMAGKLKALGIPCAYFQTVGDELDAIRDAFRLAMGRSSVVIASGGLGPTDDDRTIEGLAKSLDVELEFHEEVMDQMAARLKRPKEQFSASGRKQAYVPKGARTLKNEFGTAPCVHYPAPNGRHVFLVPGVPREMKGIFETVIAPFLEEHVPNREAIVTRHIHTYGIPESQVGDRIKDLMQAGSNPEVGTRCSGGVISVRLVATAHSVSEAEAIVEPAVEGVREALKDGVFGEGTDTLTDVAARALLDSSMTIALAESCTAGLISSSLGQIPGVSGALVETAVVYSNEAKMRCCGVKGETLERHGAVSVETVRELAAGIRERSGTDIGIGVTGIAGPGGGTEEKPVGLVFFGVASERGVRAVEKRFLGHPRNIVRERAKNMALDLIRREVTDLSSKSS